MLMTENNMALSKLHCVFLGLGKLFNRFNPHSYQICFAFCTLMLQCSCFAIVYAHTPSRSVFLHTSMNTHAVV